MKQGNSEQITNKPVESVKTIGSAMHLSKPFNSILRLKDAKKIHLVLQMLKYFGSQVVRDGVDTAHVDCAASF